MCWRLVMGKMMFKTECTVVTKDFTEPEPTPEFTLCILQGPPLCPGTKKSLNFMFLNVKSFFIPIIYLYLRVDVPPHVCDNDHGAACRSQFSLSNLWVLGMELRPSDWGRGGGRRFYLLSHLTCPRYVFKDNAVCISILLMRI